MGANSYMSTIIRGLGMPLLLLAVLAMMMVPLPPLALDVLFTFNIALSVAILLTTIYVGRPLDFGVFPTILLVVTLLRLALNIASTRIVLLNGHTGTSAAGKVIEAFGEFVVGGNYAVGLVIFGRVQHAYRKCPRASRSTRCPANRWQSMRISMPASSTRTKPANDARKSARKRISMARWTVQASSFAAMRSPAS